MGRFESKTKIVTDGLVLNLDPGVDSSITFNPPSAIEVLVVAGGGGGGVGSNGGGGGGAGGVISNSTYQAIDSAITVTVGAGGSGAPTRGSGTNGSNSVFGTLTSVGGGRGGGHVNNGGSTAPNTGGSGGGASYNAQGAAGTSITSGIGNSGGTGAVRLNLPPSRDSGGGGGGAGGPGENGKGNSGGGGAGGTGAIYTISGTPTTYAGGGAGATNDMNTRALGGSGGGGDGGTPATKNGDNGTINTGSGGGGGNGGGGSSGAGGSGIVIIRYPGLPFATGGTITQVDGFTIHTFTSSGQFTPNGIGDLSGNNNNGSFINGASFTHHLNGGRFEFDGSNDYIIVPDSNTLDGFSEVTFEAWVNSTGNSYDRIFSKNAFSAYNFSLGSDNSFYFYINGQFSNAQTLTTPNQWNHLIGVYTGNEAIFYLNGSQVFSEPFSQGTVGSNNVDLYVGVSDGVSSQFRGSMGPVRMYNRVLTEGDVIQNFNADRDRFGI